MVATWLAVAAHATHSPCERRGASRVRTIPQHVRLGAPGLPAVAMMRGRRSTSSHAGATSRGASTSPCARRAGHATRPDGGLSQTRGAEPGASRRSVARNPICESTRRMRSFGESRSPRSRDSMQSGAGDCDDKVCRTPRGACLTLTTDGLTGSWLGQELSSRRR
jgi:hypothetical protein